MFVKFTRLDGTPIWINSTFVVTIEPRRNGGATVVPIGDGLDYDVRETAEQALALLGQGAAPAKSEPAEPAPKAEDAGEPSVAAKPAAKPAKTAKAAKGATSRAAASADWAAATPQVEPPADAEPATDAEKPAADEPTPEETAAALQTPELVVAVPPPKALPEKFADVVATGLSAPQPDEVDTKPVIEVSPAPEAKPARAKRKTKAQAAAEGEEPAEAKPKKATRTRTAKAKKAAAEPEAEKPAPELAVEPPPAVLEPAQIERLRKMAPGSLKKLKNTLASQFRVTEIEAAVHHLIETRVLAVDAQDHVTWALA